MRHDHIHRGLGAFVRGQVKAVVCFLGVKGSGDAAETGGYEDDARVGGFAEEGDEGFG